MNASLKVLLLLVAASAPASTAPRNRLTTVDWESYHEHEHQGPGSYAFGYDVQDPLSGNTQFREETRRPDGSVRGSYGLVEPDGNVRIVHYVADDKGFRVHIENTQKPNEVHPGPRTYENQISTIGEFGRKLISRPIVVGAASPAPPTVATIAAPIIVQAEPQVEVRPQPQIAQVEFRPQPTVEIRPQPQVEIRSQPPIEIRHLAQPQRLQPLYLAPTASTHYLQYQHGYFHRK